VANSAVRTGRVLGIVVAAAPTVAFVVANALSSLYPALAAAGITAVAAFAWRLRRHQSLRQAVIGLLLVVACAGVAAITGQARRFFLIPTLIPFAVITICVITVLAGRPLTGLLLNRVAGGPANWRELPRLRRVYVVSTLVCAAVNLLNAIVQVVFYVADQPIVLGAAHIATGPVFALIVAVTIGFVRRARGAGAPLIRR
jgi:intracellular septation protein A